MHLIFWLLLSFLVRAQEGNGLDPHGGPTKTSVGRVRASAGSFIDPIGVHAQDGAGLDPHGVRAQGGGDKGLGVDPNG